MRYLAFLRDAPDQAKRLQRRFQASPLTCLFFVVAATLVFGPLLEAQGFQPPGRNKRLSGDALPTYVIVHEFFDSVLRHGQRGEAELQGLLESYGIPSPSDVRDVLIQEATLAMHLRDLSRERTVAAAKRRERSAEEHSSWSRQEQLGLAEDVGECFGRFLARVQVAGRRAAAFEDILRHRIVGSLNYVDDPGALGFVHQLEASFRRGMDQGLALE